MGREIRKVPKGWEHPKNENGDFMPLLDSDYEAEAEEWLKNCDSWRNGTHEYFEEYGKDNKYYWEWEGNPPDKEYYRPKFESEPNCFQIYETVSEGTPTSPVFETKEDMIKWLVKEGYSEKAATNFAKEEWAPSMVIIPGRGILNGIHSSEF